MSDEPDEPERLPLPPAIELLRSIWELNHALEQVSLRLDRAIGITAPQRLLLRIVGRYPGLTAGALARLHHVDPGTISVRLRDLERAGLLTRTKDPRDRRRVTVALTAAGRALDGPLAGSAEAAVERVLAVTAGAELHGATHLLAALSRALRSTLEEPLGHEPARAVRRGVRRSPEGRG